MLKGITLDHWRQFDHVGIDFHERLTVLTGANGAGKTTILHILNRHWGWNIPYASTPRFTKKGLRKYWAGFWGESQPFGQDEPAQPQLPIGQVRYRDHGPTEITVPADVTQQFSPQIRGMPPLAGVYVPSHRPLYVQQEVDQIPTKVDARQQLFDNYLSELRGLYAINRRVQSVSHKLKTSLISLAVFGFGNQAAVPNDEARRTFEGFEQTLRVVLPNTLEFLRLRVRTPDVLLETGTGSFSLDAVSGGISALVDLAWQVFLYSTLHDEFVVVIDEPEAHLHPQLQKEVLPSLLEAFPSAQFVVATHNPFVVTSVRDSNVYVLRYNDRQRVESLLLDNLNKAGTSNEILREVLGLESASPAWVEDRFDQIVSRYAGQTLSRDLLGQLRRDLEELGLGRYVPRAIDLLIDEGG